MCDLRQLHPDTGVPRDCMYHTQKHTEMQTHGDDIITLLCKFTTGDSPGGGEAAYTALCLAHGSQQLHRVRGQSLV